jgi:uncharacterized protein YjiS (DUF1127 family)
MISTAIDRLETPTAPAGFPTREGAPRVETSSRVGAGKSRDRRRQSRNPGGLVRAVIAVVFAYVSVWRERGRARRQLAVMSDRELQDIGICRSEIAYEIGKPFWRALALASAVR